MCSYDPADKWKVLVDEHVAFQAMKLIDFTANCNKVVFKIRRKLKILRSKKALQSHRLSLVFYPMWKMLILTCALG
jgi:hypothetical protein